MLDLNAKNAFIILKKYLGEKNPNKFEHSIRVAQTAKKLAAIWGVSQEESVISALLHDIGKCFTRQQMLELCSRNNVPLYEFEIFDNITALHGKVSSLIMDMEFSKDDIDKFNRISHAVSAHVAGAESMSDLDKILFIADNIEPQRKNNFMARIESGELNTLNKCVKEIILDKWKRSDSENRVSNPFYKCTMDAIDDEER